MSRADNGCAASSLSRRRRGRLGVGGARCAEAGEPPAATHGSVQRANVIITPHCATARPVQEEKLPFGLDNVMAFHEGREIQARLA